MTSCPYCPEDFADEMLLARHLVREHIKTISFEPESRYKHSIHCWCKWGVLLAGDEDVPDLLLPHWQACGGIQQHFLNFHLGLEDHP